MIRVLAPDAREGTLTVSGARAHHLRVLRVGVGDELEVFDGLGKVYPARVSSVGEPTVLTLGPGVATPATRAVTVVQGLPKADKLELVLQKATELGAAAIAPVVTSRSVVKLAGREVEKQARWQRVAEEAARQCGRADVPSVSEARPLVEAVEALAVGTAVLVLDEEERSLTLGAALSALSRTTPLALVIGPEGGLAREELAELVRLGAVPVTLGRLVLRTETAALVALAVVRHLDGELG